MIINLYFNLLLIQYINTIFFMSYFVVGGTYKNTSFNEFEDGFKKEKYGPFNSFEDAKSLWEKISWENVDNCNVRFIILPQK